MGYPSPAPPSNATPDELLQFNPASTVLIGKVGLKDVLLEPSLIACAAAIRVSTANGHLLWSDQNEHSLFLPKNLCGSQAYLIFYLDDSRECSYGAMVLDLCLYHHLPMRKTRRCKLGDACGSRGVL